MNILGVDLKEVRVTLGNRQVTGYFSPMPLPALVNGGGVMRLTQTVEYDQGRAPLQQLEQIWQRVLVSRIRGLSHTLLTDGDDASRRHIWCFQQLPS